MTITREEAIRILSTRDAHGVLCGYTNGVTEALDMAIEALKAEPTGDLISRTNAIEAWDKLSKRGRTEFDQVLMTLPSADVVSREDYHNLLMASNDITKSCVFPQKLVTVGDYPNDVISRNALMEYCSNQKSKTIDNNDIARFPSADAEWIPCSERLPEEGEKVLASTTNTIFTQVFKGTHGTFDSWWWNNNTIKTIYAWMPLPKPYR